MKNTTLLLLACVSCIGVMAQTAVKTYYDYAHKQVHELYYTDGYGVKNGSYTEYSQYGGILQQGTYKDGKTVGKWIYKSDKGVLMLDATFDNEGKYNGKVFIYSNDEHFEGSYRHGVKIGHCKTWYSSEEGGQLHLDEYYNRKGQYDSIWTEYSQNGKIKQQGFYKDSIQVGEWRIFSEGGTLRSDEHLANGQLDGNCKYYNIDGILQKDENYRQGNKNGNFKHYNDKSILISDENYKDGRAEGKFIYYDGEGSGVIMDSGRYVNDTARGSWRATFDANGKYTFTKSQAAYYAIIIYEPDGNKKETDYTMDGGKKN